MDESADRPNSFHKRLKTFRRDLAGAQQGSVEALHRARVVARRFSELLPLLDIDFEIRRKLKRRLRQVTKQFGDVRELDVLAALLEDLRQSGGYPLPAVKILADAVSEARVEARTRLAARLPTPRLNRLADRLETALRSCESRSADIRQSARRPKRTWLWALEARLVHRAFGVRAAIEAAGAVYAPQRLHDVRLALKKLRYAVELLDEGPSVAADLATLRAAQDTLGRLNDLQALVTWGREVQTSLVPPSITGLRALGALVHAIEDDCRRLHARYMRERASLIVMANRIGAGRTADVAIQRKVAG